MKKIGVVLSGCGVKDGSEIHEAVLTLLAIDHAGAQALCMAPNNDLAVVDHLTQQETGERRHVLVESARIARGHIHDITQVKANDIDALVFPGGFGAVKNLCNFATAGTRSKPHPEVERLVKEVYLAQKPIGAICISPALIASILGRDVHPALTIGNDAGTAEALEAMGAKHHACAVTDIHVDEVHKIVSTPAYMVAKSIGEAAQGIEKLVRQVVAWA